jgi:ATP-dependent RNA helicase DeaD
MEKRRFTELGLSEELLKAVDKMGFEEASPIQTAVIPLLLQGRDVVGQSSTGSGKTAAFGIPAIERVDPKLRAPQALILCPTRELAVQVAEEMGKLSYFKRGVQVVPIYGGQSYERQFRALDAGAQVVIGTPGRVLDHMSRGTLRLKDLKLVVLDEADRMLDMGFRDDIQRILEEVPEQRQLLFFSATMPAQIRDMIQQFAHEPEWITIQAQAMNAPKVDQSYFEVDRRSKVEVLTRLIDLHDFRYGIIFCSTKIMVDDLDEHLHSRGYSVDRLHGDISQTQRDRVMAKFRQRGFEFLIATDVAARGLDVDDLEVVFNYDLPNDAEDYTHRIGRTGRAGRSGMAVTFVSGREIYKLQSMVRYAGLRIRRERVPSLDEVEEARENAFFERLRGVLDRGNFARQERMVDRLLEQGYTSTDIASALIHLLQGGTDLGENGSSSSKSAGRPEASSAAASTPAPAAPQARPEAPEPAPRAASAASAAPVAKAEVKPVIEAVPALEPAAETPEEPQAPRSKPAKEAPKEMPEWVSSRKKQRHVTKAGRTGQSGYLTIRLNVGMRNQVTPADIVGKIAGVTRMPASIVGAIDIQEAETLVDVQESESTLVLAKLVGVRVKGQSLKPTPYAL